MDSDVDIGALPILEWQFSVHCILFRYWNGSLQSHIFSSDIGITDVYICRMSDIADIKMDVDAHLWYSVIN
jgi:hypothetical protein